MTDGASHPSSSPLFAELFETLFMDSPLGKAIIDNNYRYIRINRKLAEDINGNSIEYFIGKTVEEAIGKESWQKTATYYDRAFAGEIIRDVPVQRVRRSDNQLRHYSTTFYPLAYEGKDSFIAVVFQDITTQYNTEREIAQYRTRLEMAQHAGGIGLFEWDMRTNKAWFSSEELELLGIQAHEAQGTVSDLKDRLHPEDQKKVVEIIKTSAENHQPYDAEFRVLLPNNEVRWLRGRGQYTYDENGVAIQMVGVNYDVTKRKKEEEILKFRAESSRLLTPSLDAEKVIQGVCDTAVKYFADWCGVDILEGDVFKLLAVAHKDQAQLAFAKKIREKFPSTLKASKGLAHVVQTGQPLFINTITEEMINQAKLDKEQQKILDKLNLSSLIIVPIHILGKVVGGITLAWAESKKKYEESDVEVANQLATRVSLFLENSLLYSQVKSEQKRLKNLLANVPCLVWEIKGNASTPLQEMIFINSYTRDLFGYPVKKLLEDPNFSNEITHPDDRERLNEEMRKVYLSSNPGVIRFRMKHKSGNYIWVESHFNPVVDNKGIIVGLRGVTTDISERKLLEQRKDEFIAMASHELKTPLTSLKVFTQVLKAHLSTQKETKVSQYLDRMENQIDRLTELVFDLLDLSRIQRGKLTLEKELFPLHELVEEVVQSVQPTVTHNLVFKKPVPTFISGDRHRLSQVFMNLVGNATKYSPKADKVLIEMKQSENKVIVSVQDFGIGISPEHKEHIFERFYRVFDDTDKTFPGLGMGLFIAKNIVKRHQGEMWFESDPQRGSTFFVSLPIEQKRRKNAKSSHH